MHKRVNPVEKGHDTRVITHKVALKFRFHNREHPSEDRLVLKPKNIFTMSLGNLNYTHLSRCQPLCCRLGDGVEQKVDSPIEHLHQEREFIQDATVDMVGPTRRVWCRDRNATNALFRDWVGRLSADLVVFRVEITAGCTLIDDSVAENAVILAPVEDKRTNHDAHDYLSFSWSLELFSEAE